MRVNRHFLAISALFLIALSVRYIPLLFSHLPFNIDGFPLIRISEDIIESGKWDLDYQDGTSGFITYNSKMPVMSLLIATFAMMFGKTPLQVAQVAMPLISVSAVVIIYSLAFKITNNHLVSFFAGLALALNGFYVYFGAAVMKETVGLVFLILSIYLYQGRDDPRNRALASAIFLLIGLTHHLTLWMAFTMVTILAFTSQVIQYSQGTFTKKRFILDIISGPFMFFFSIVYYTAVDMSFFNKVSNFNDIALYSAVLLSGILLSIVFCAQGRSRKKRHVVFNKTLIIPAGGLAFILFNNSRTVFSGTIKTPGLLLKFLIPYLLLCFIALVGLNVLAQKKTQYKPLVAAIILTPFLIILFGFLKGFDAFTFVLVYRSVDYLDFGLAICAGIGAGYLIKGIVSFVTRGKDDSRLSLSIKAVLSVIFLVICLATLPLAYQADEFYGIQDSTYQNEFSAISWVSDAGGDFEFQSDSRLSDIAGPYFDLQTQRTIPWQLKYNQSLESGSILFLEDRWTSKGAQMTPLEPVVIPPQTLKSTIESNNLIYANSGSNSEVYIVLVG